MALPRQTLNSQNVQVLPPSNRRRRPRDSPEQDGSSSECRTRPRLEVNNFEEQHDVSKSPTLDSTAGVASFARSHHNTFHNSTINTIGGDQINLNDWEAGLKLLYREIRQVGAFYDSEDRFPPPRCHPQTREAVRADISAWIKDQNTSPSLQTRNSNQNSARSSQALVHWLYGPAGAGKSAITQTLAESFKDSHLAASFFFSRSSSKRNNPRTLFTTVAYCLAVSKDTKLRAAIDKAVLERHAILGASIESQFLELVVKPLENLPRERWGNLPKVVIIDGLDECQGSDSQRRVLTTILSQLVDDKGQPRYRIPLRFLIASRPEPQIRDVFNKPEYLDITTRTELGDNYSTSRDIERYLRDSFHEIARTSDAMRGVPLPWPSHGVIDNLVQKASGQFIYASTLIKYVSDEYSHPAERLELALGLPIGDPDAFSDLDLLYRQIMSSSRNRPRVLQILGAFFCLQEVDRYLILHPRESIVLFENMLFLPQGAISLALRNLHSVLEINQYSFHFRHKSFTEFLLDERRSGEFFLDLPLYHELITRCCMKIVPKASQTGILQLFHSPQWRYARDNFFYHLEHSKITDPLINDLKNFNFLYCFRPGIWTLSQLLRFSLPYDTSRRFTVSDCEHHLYLRLVILECYKYSKILTEKFQDSLQQPTSNLKHGFYASSIRKNYLHFISEMEVSFAFLRPDSDLYENPHSLILTEIVDDLRLDNLCDSLAEISICHPCFYPPTLNPDCGDWYFIDLSRGHSSIVKCYLKKIRLDRNFRLDHNFCTNWSWSRNFRWSSHELSLVEELLKTIEFLHEYELLEAINWLQRYPDKCHIVNNAIDKCTEQITNFRSSYQPTMG
ncbi:hypothetical protein K435DRAFT_967303 [Dendrothele bispora CBS 962.96]|uniref:NACHT domain-containing protein n=1 Tax=Dendrothele bispora (strain CBS 962.96) TaxID=1314807 RepID=A0A4S8LV51_DENBC|nr:hypothetical protein K435DRAFT_967303 [Dendrothele bispora CBS 962.96]